MVAHVTALLRLTCSLLIYSKQKNLQGRETFRTFYLTVLQYLKINFEDERW